DLHSGDLVGRAPRGQIGFVQTVYAPDFGEVRNGYRFTDAHGAGHGVAGAGFYARDRAQGARAVSVVAERTIVANGFEGEAGLRGVGLAHGYAHGRLGGQIGDGNDEERVFADVDLRPIDADGDAEIRRGRGQDVQPDDFPRDWLEQIRPLTQAVDFHG